MALKLKMKRKLIQLAGKTLVVSLPSNWVKKYGLKKGEEIDLSEEDGRIILITKKNIQQNSIKIDIGNLNFSLIWRYIFAAYIKGADEIEINYKNKQQKEWAQQVADTLIGFALVKEQENFLLLKDVSGESTEFDTILRRIFFMLSALSQEGLEAIKKRDNPTLIELKKKDFKINYLVNFCLRYLNKKGYSDYKKAHMLYSTIRNLEFLGDEYSELFEKIAKDKLKIGKEFIKILEETNKMFEDYHKVFYKFETEKALGIVSYRDVLQTELEKYSSKASDNELKVIGYLRTIILIIFNLLEPKLEEVL